MTVDTLYFDTVECSARLPVDELNRVALWKKQHTRTCGDYLYRCVRVGDASITGKYFFASSTFVLQFSAPAVVCADEHHPLTAADLDTLFGKLDYILYLHFLRDVWKPHYCVTAMTPTRIDIGCNFLAPDAVTGAAFKDISTRLMAEANWAKHPNIRVNAYDKVAELAVHKKNPLDFGTQTSVQRIEFQTHRRYIQNHFGNAPLRQVLAADWGQIYAAMLYKYGFGDVLPQKMYWRVVKELLSERRQDFAANVRKYLRALNKPARTGYTMPHNPRYDAILRDAGLCLYHAPNGAEHMPVFTAL